MMWPDLGKCIENMKLIDKVTETKYLPYPSRSRRIKNKRRNKRKKWKMMIELWAGLKILGFIIEVIIAVIGIIILVFLWWLQR